MPTIDGGHVFLSVLAPIRRGTFQGEDGARTSHEIALRQAELKEYETLLPAQAAFWEGRNHPSEAKTVWALVEPQKLSNPGTNQMESSPMDPSWHPASPVPPSTGLKPTARLKKSPG